MSDTEITRKYTQEDAERDYYQATTGIRDRFDCLDADDVNDADEEDRATRLAYLASLAPMLAQWWEAINALDSTQQDEPSVFCTVLTHELRNWFGARQRLLNAIAGHCGVIVPRPDDPDGSVTTSNRYVGYFTYTPN